MQWNDVSKILAADDTGGQNAATAQPWFPTAGAVAVLDDQAYLLEGQLRLSRSAGAVSHTTGILFAGTAALTSIDYIARCKTGDTLLNAAMNAAGHNAATELVVKAASTSASEQTLIMINGIIRVNVAGTLIPQFKYSAAPGGTPTVKRGSYFIMTAVGVGNRAVRGTWS